MRRLQQANPKKQVSIGELRGLDPIGQLALDVSPVLERRAVKLFRNLRSSDETPLVVSTTSFISESIGHKIEAKVMDIKPPGLLFKADSSG
jgi:hypothetical protein